MNQSHDTYHTATMLSTVFIQNQSMHAVKVSPLQSTCPFCSPSQLELKHDMELKQTKKPCLKRELQKWSCNLTMNHTAEAHLGHYLGHRLLQCHLGRLNLFHWLDELVFKVIRWDKRDIKCRWIKKRSMTVFEPPINLAWAHSNSNLFCNCKLLAFFSLTLYLPVSGLKGTGHGMIEEDCYSSPQPLGDKII